MLLLLLLLLSLLLSFVLWNAQPDILGNYVVAHMKLLRGRCHMTMAKKPTGLMRSYHIALTKNGRYSQAITAK